MDRRTLKNQCCLLIDQVFDLAVLVAGSVYVGWQSMKLCLVFRSAARPHGYSLHQLD
jgi:hypothetical protein